MAELLVKVWPRRTLDERVAQLTNDWRDWRGPEAEFPRSVIIREGGRVIAHAAVLPRTIGTSEGDMTILALARVCTDPAERGRKLGQAVVRAAFDAGRPRAVSAFAVSNVAQTCGRSTRSSVRAWSPTGSSIRSADDPQTNPFWDEVVMRYPAAKPWPEGEIDLRGPGY